MKLRHSFFSLALTLVSASALDARAAEQPLSASTIVVYNKAVSDSVELAKFYAQQRGIARDHLVGLTCSTEEEISREDFDATIADPLREIFKTRHWWTMRETPEQTEAVLKTSIRFVAVIKGMPLKIRPTAAPYPGDEPAAGPVKSAVGQRLPRRRWRPARGRTGQVQGESAAAARPTVASPAGRSAKPRRVSGAAA